MPEATLTPLLGNPEAITAAASRYATTADDLLAAAEHLRLLANHDTIISTAVDDVRAKAAESYTSTVAIVKRYAAAAGVLEHYAQDLETAQKLAQHAITLSAQAGHQAALAEQRLHDLKRQAETDFGQTPTLVHDLLAAGIAAKNTAADVTGAAALWGRAELMKGQAVKVAIAGLADAGTASGLNDTLLQELHKAVSDIKKTLSDAYKWAQTNLAPVLEDIHTALTQISKILNVVTTIVSIAAVFLPVLAPLAAGLNGLNAAVAIATLATSIALVLLGRGTLTSVISDAVGVILAKVGGKIGSEKGFGKSVGDSIAPRLTKGPVIVADDAAEGALKKGEYFFPTLAKEARTAVTTLPTREAMTKVVSRALSYPADRVADAAVDFSSKIVVGAAQSASPPNTASSWNEPAKIDFSSAAGAASSTAAFFVETAVKSTGDSFSLVAAGS